uniref:Pentacotripeptide-repeat region of PRORP domain-containing protein n=1 Tax=Salix viminalis TaxID=40686 RepID=A0A6N2MD09_SALVM
MEMGIFPFLPHFPCFLFLKHHHFLTSTSTKKPSLPKKNDGLVSDNSNNISIDDALASFYRMVRMNPRPSVVEFGKFLGSIAKKKQYSTVVSLCNQMDLLGVTHNVYSLTVLINCLCRSKHVHFAVSVLGKMFKLGIQPNAITFNALTNGFCNEGKIKDRVV